MKQFKKVLSVLLVSLLVFGTAFVALAADTAEAEPNSTAATATAFTTSAKGNLSSIDDVDYYKTTLTAGAAKLTFTSVSSTAIYKVEVLDKDEKVVETLTVNAGAGTSTTPEFSVSAADYYVKVCSGSLTGTEDYSFSIEVTAKANYEAEPNNTSGTATVIPASAIKSSFTDSTAYSGAISAGDVDYFKITITNPEGYFRINFQNTGSSAFKVTVIQNTTGKTIAEMEITSSDTEVICSDIGVANGTYFIKVEGADAETTGGYSFVVLSKLDSMSEMEYNGDPSNATTLVLGTTIYASISYPADYDFYKVTSNQDTEITVSATTDSRNDGSVTWTAELYNATNTSAPVDSVTVSKAQTATFDLRDYAAGVYYVVIKAGSNYSAGNYQITSKEVTKSSSSSSSLIDRIKALDWKGFWTNNFKDLLGNIDIWSTLGALLKLSVGTITKYIASLN